MELELVAWMGHRLARRPWMAVTWLGLVSICWTYPSTERYIIPGDPTTWARVSLQCACLWWLLAGIFGLGALEELETRIRALGFCRRWRIRGILLATSLMLPTLPMLLPVAGWAGPGGGGNGLLAFSALLMQSLLAAFVVDRCACGPLRPGLYLTLLWWAPALAPRFFLGAGPRLDGIDPTGFGTGNLFDSPLWIGWAGSMLALAATALALDLLRRPAA